MKPRRPGLKPAHLFWLFCLAFAASILYLGLHGWRPEDKYRAPELNATQAPAQGDETAPASDAGPLPYEESLDQPLEEAARQVDTLLVRAIEAAGGDPQYLRLVDMEDRVAQGRTEHRLIMEAVLASGADLFVDALARMLAEEIPEASMVVVDPATENQGNATALPGQDRPQVVVRIAVQGVPTHELSVYAVHDPARFERDPIGLTADTPLMAVIIDDMGENVRFANDLALLDYPVTFSIWPRSGKAWETAQVAFESGLEVMVHQPMEPLDYPKFRPGPGAVYLNMPPEEIRRAVLENIGRVPYASGLNNHMGSRFTQDPEAMGAVMEVLAEQGLFAVDSLTTPRSALAAQAAEHSVPCVIRDVFLDVARDEHAIVVQLEKTQRLALKRGVALAIGHPYPETLAALRTWNDRRDTRVRIVSVRALLERNNARSDY